MKKLILSILAFLIFLYINYAYGAQSNLKSMVHSSIIVIGKVEKKDYEYKGVNVDNEGEKYGTFVAFNVEKYLKEPLKKELIDKSNIIIFEEVVSDTRVVFFEPGERYLVFVSEFINPPSWISGDAVYKIKFISGKLAIRDNMVTDYWNIFGTEGAWVPLESAINKIKQFVK